MTIEERKAWYLDLADLAKELADGDDPVDTVMFAYHMYDYGYAMALHQLKEPPEPSDELKELKAEYKKELGL